MLRKLREGRNDYQVASELSTETGVDVSHDSVRRRRLRFTKEGRLEARLTTRRTSRRSRAPIRLEVHSWNEIQEALLLTMQQARRVETLESENNRLRNVNAALKNQLEVAEKQLKDTLEHERRYKLALQQGDVPTPLVKKR